MFSCGCSCQGVQRPEGPRGEDQRAQEHCEKKRKCEEMMIRQDASVNHLGDDFEHNTEKSHLLATTGDTPWRKSYSDGYVKVKSVMDSGAFECVAPPTLAPGVPIADSSGSRRKQHYVTASKGRIPNMGQQTLRGETHTGKRAKMTYQIAEVSRPLTAVGSTCD